MDKQKKMILIGVTVVVLIIASFWMISRKSSIQKETSDLEPTEEILPTVDDSVKVDLKSAVGLKEVLLTVKNIPEGTTSLRYALSYETVEGGLQGTDSTAEIKSSNFEKKITLGTCSSGTCVYHNVKGKIKVELIFTGGYGDKSFTKEYAL
ncbi:MAG: hypothetical protein V1803_01485 [Candidatus Roizmanbacteria bacterium]